MYQPCYNRRMVVNPRAVTILIPAYNEAETLGPILAQVRELNPGAEILIVDDGSTDDTAQIGAEGGARVIRHPYNKGNGASIKTGLRQATGEVVVIFDADGQHEPRDICKLVECLDEYDLVVAARDTRSETEFGRRLYHALLNAFASYIADRPIPDATAGFRAARRSRLLQFIHLLPNGFSTPVTTTLAFVKAGYSVKFVPSTMFKRAGGQSKISPVNDGMRFILIVFRMITLFAPMKVFLPVSLGLTSIGIIYTAFDMVFISGRLHLANTAVLLVLMGILTFLIGSGFRTDRGAAVRTNGERMSARGWLRLLGVALLVALVFIFKIDLAKTATLIAHADLLAVGLALILFVPFLAAKAWRWQVILRDLSISIPFGEAVKLYALGLGAGMITPGQVGDAVKIAYLRERGLGRALLSVLLDRLWDVLVLLLFAASGALLFWQQLEGEWFAIALLAAGTVGLLAITASPRAQVKLLKLLSRMRRSGAGPDAFDPVQLSPMQIVRQFTLTLLATAIVYVRYYLLTLALNVHLDLVPFVAAMSLATVAALLPISISGLGARDAALLLVAGSIGITREQALGVSALILFMSVVNGLVGFGVWLFQSRGVAGLKVGKLES